MTSERSSYQDIESGDRAIVDPQSYALIDPSRQECVDWRTRANRDARLLVVRGPAGSQALLFVRATLDTVSKFDEIERGDASAVTVYDLLKDRRTSSRVLQTPNMHTGVCKRSAHGQEVDARIASPSRYMRARFAELAEVYAERLRVPSGDLLDRFKVVGLAAMQQVAHLEELGTPSQEELIRSARELGGGEDNISVMSQDQAPGGPCYYLINHHPRMSLDATTMGDTPAYVDTPAALTSLVMDTWELTDDEKITATAAILANTYATQDTLTAMGALRNYEAYETSDNGLTVMRSSVVRPDGTYNI